MGEERGKACNEMIQKVRDTQWETEGDLRKKVVDLVGVGIDPVVGSHDIQSVARTDLGELVVFRSRIRGPLRVFHKEGNLVSGIECERLVSGILNGIVVNSPDIKLRAEEGGATNNDVLEIIEKGIAGLLS